MEEKVRRYFVWRRSDGYVNGSAGSMPKDYQHSQFEKLLETTDWYGEAAPLIEAERAKPDYPNIEATWNKD